jgi:hypothetical protein
VRPAPALPPDVQAQWERAQWILYLLRRRVHCTTMLPAPSALGLPATARTCWLAISNA